MEEMEQMVSDCQGAIKTLTVGGLEAIRLAGESVGKLTREVTVLKGMCIGIGAVAGIGIGYLIVENVSQKKKVAKLEEAARKSEQNDQYRSNYKKEEV